AVGLADQAGRRPHQLSGGQRQRVGIARALMNGPAVLLVDEPTSALDHERGAAVLSLLATLTKERGTATVLVTHDRAALAHADRVTELRDGHLHHGATGGWVGDDRREAADHCDRKGGENPQPTHREADKAGPPAPAPGSGAS
ncbi:ATP-binding cassette domain-containing protein, partial [Streptomyces sp. NPDC005904]|uniref:ATP-binding cassette domain-containing protein n=1 Tax=Streptomyces sp. NPDC005904 TaxID=3154570 RepID=UPI0034064C69